MIARLFSPCALGHGDWHRGRDEQGRPAKLCDRCQHPIGLLLAGEMITTPLPQVVAGEPQTVVTRERRNNVTRIRQSSR